jgi:hypothetical protein
VLISTRFGNRMMSACSDGCAGQNWPASQSLR